VRRLTWDEVWGRRLARHRLLEAAPAPELVSLAGELCGIHAQVMTSAELSIGARVAGATRVVVRHELWERRRLVKTYGIRGTVHLLPAAELPLWMAALRAGRPPARGGPGRLEPAQVDAVIEAIRGALDGQLLTRDELGAEVVRRLGAWAGEESLPAFGGALPVWTDALSAAAAAGALCFGPNRGARVTFVRPDQWLGGWRDVDRTEALREVTRRYVAAYGPVTSREFAQWFYLVADEASAAFHSLGDELEQVDVEGEPRWLPAGEPEESEPFARGSVRLLASFDCYVVGAHPRDQLVPPRWAEWGLRHRTTSKWQKYGRMMLCGPLPVLLVDGVVAGMWDRQRRGRVLEVSVQPFAQLSAAQRRLVEAEAARVGEVLGERVTLVT
jgi:hypothetical protein